MSCRITHPCILLLSYTYTHDSIKTFSERKLNSWSKYKSLGWLHKTIEEKHKRAQSSNVLQQIQPINPLKFDNNSQFHSPSFFFFFLLLLFFSPANIEPSNQSSDVPAFTCKFPIQILFTHLYRRSQTSIDRSWPSTCVHEAICTRLGRCRPRQIQRHRFLDLIAASLRFSSFALSQIPPRETHPAIGVRRFAAVVSIDPANPPCLLPLYARKYNVLLPYCGIRREIPRSWKIRPVNWRFSISIENFS